MAKKATLEFKRSLHAPAAEVFLALTNATALREWFCDTAVIEPRKGGAVYFGWNEGFYAAGEITRLSPGRKLAFTWAGRGEPDTTDVEISLTPQKDASLVRVRHAGVRSGKKWKHLTAQVKEGWETSLENLQAVLETGQDLRLTRRPRLGVTGLTPLTPEVAAGLHLPPESGIRLDGTVPGLGAEAAGLQKGDVLLSLGERRITTWASLAAALQAHHAGDIVAVSVWRGGEKQRLKLELSPRPVPAVPPTATELAQTVRLMYDTTDAELANALQGLSPAAAAQPPAPGEWSVSEVLAHLLLGERDTHAWLADLVAGEERTPGLVDGTGQLRLQATAATYGSAAALLEELKHTESETVAMLAALPEAFVHRKRSYARAAEAALQAADHTREHLRQIEAAASAAPAEPPH